MALASFRRDDHRPYPARPLFATEPFVLLQAVVHIVKKSPYLKKLYDRVKRKHGGNTARIAVARKLLSIMLGMLLIPEEKANRPQVA
jgi:hypothetical protein